jgi:hypothetical protein
MIVPLALLCFFCALVPAIMFCVNLHFYRQPPALPAAAQLPAVSILIPARNEAAAIADCLHAALATRNITFEIIVMDDASTDATPDIVQSIAQSIAQPTAGEPSPHSQLKSSPLLTLEVAFQPRIRLEQAPPLPAGWNGKQHACYALARAARHPILCFVDADVRLAPDCIARMAGFLESTNSALVSGFPRQLTGSWLEWMLLPLIHFVLLGFLPIARMRKGTDPAFAAGCGQFMLVRRDSYFATGGHAAIKLTMHDGLRLPRLFRQHNLRTDLADLTHLATCRMYTSAAQVWSGLAKNATEGLADPARIVPVSLVLLLGQVLPLFTIAVTLIWAAIAVAPILRLVWHHAFVFGASGRALAVIALALGAAFCAYLPRILAILRFRQSWRGALLHPIGILLLLAVQWYALLRTWRGGPIAWRDRTYQPNTTP